MCTKLWRSQEEEWTSNYYITRCTGSSISWRKDSGMRNMSQRGWAPRPPVEQPRRTGKKCCYGHKSGGQYVAVLFSLQLTSHTVKPLVTLSNPSKLEWEVYFFKELCRSSLLGHRYDSECRCICVCIVVHGYTTFQAIQLTMSTQFNYQKIFLLQATQFSQTVLIQIIQFSISIVFVRTQLNVKTVLFQVIQFCKSTQLSSSQVCHVSGLTYLEPQGTVPQGSNPSWRG